MKKTLCIVLAVMLLCATFVGCSQTTSSSSASGNSSQGDFSKESSKQEDTSSEGITLNYLATYETQNEQAMKNLSLAMSPKPVIRSILKCILMKNIWKSLRLDWVRILTMSIFLK